MNNLYSPGILGTGRYLPEKVITNHDLEKVVNTSDEWIVSRTGIKERRIAPPEMATSDLASEAAKIAIEDAGIKADELDCIIVATVTPDMAFPSTACIVQNSIGAVNAAAFDLEAACSGFLYGISIAAQFIQTGFYEKILVIGADCLSKITNWKDRNTCVLFGDGAGAVVMGRVPDDMGILSINLGADGTGGNLLQIQAGGSRMPATWETVEKELHYIQMDGSEVFKFASRIMTSAALEAVRKAGIKLEEVDFVVPHQANIRIIESARKRMKLPAEKIFVNLDRYGNMSAASIPVALDEAVRQGKIQKGDHVILVGFGGGLTWGSCLIRWNK